MKRKTQEIFENDVKNIVGEEYTVLGKYINNSTKIRFRHEVCGHEFEMTPNNFLRGKRCPFCNKMRHKNEDEFKEQLREKNPTMFLINGYENSMTPAVFYHMDCGRTFSATPTSMLNGKRCPFCYNRLSGASERFQNDINERFGGRIFLLESFKSESSLCSFRCSKCGKNFKAKPKTLTHFVRCPICADSDPKVKIERFLDVAGFEYEKDKPFYSGCMMKFDFYIQELNLAIDYNGRFYYDALHGIKSLDNERAKKYLKNSYCKQHKIKLLRIPFWKAADIDQILYDLFMEVDKKTSYTQFHKWRQQQNFGTYKNNKK